MHTHTGEMVDQQAHLNVGPFVTLAPLTYRMKLILKSLDKRFNLAVSLFLTKQTKDNNCLRQRGSSELKDGSW